MPATGDANHNDRSGARLISRSINTLPSILAATFLVAFAIVLPSGATAGIPESAIIASYGFEESGGGLIIDQSGSGNDSRLESGARRTGGGRFGAGVEFDGSNSGRVSLGGLDVSGQGLTISMWFKADDFGTNDARLISKAVGADNHQHYWMVSTIRVNNKMRLRFRLKTANGGTTELRATSGTPLTARTYTHVAVTYDGSRMSIYQNGERVAVKSKSGNIRTNASVKAWIGQNPVGGKRFDGIIDNVRIYRKSLTATQIRDDMQKPVGTATAQAVTGSSSLKLDWSPSSGTVDGYRVYLGDSASSTPLYISNLRLSRSEYDPNAPSVTYDIESDLGLTRGETACFRVSAYNGHGNSEQSTVACKQID